jgi:hypothetical protein
MEINDSDFCYMVDGKYGSSVGDQARSLLFCGEELEEQNPNALKEILVFAKKYKKDLAEEIEEYLNETQADHQESA